MPAVETSVFGEFCAAGLWPGAGPALVAALADAGIDRPAAITEEALAALPKVSAKRARTLHTAWVLARPRYELATLLLSHGLPLGWVRRLADTLGDTAAESVAADPWQVLALWDAEVDQADALARQLDGTVDVTDPRRGRALVARALGRTGRDGHTCSPVGVVTAQLRAFGVSSRDEVNAAVQAAIEHTLVRSVASPDGGAPWLALEPLAAAEEEIALHTRRLERAAQPLDGSLEDLETGLDQHQRAAVHAALTHGVSILTGGPGTGKSRTVTAVVSRCLAVGAEVLVAAPTGRAAKRLAELMSEAGVNGEAGTAVTIHRLLGARKLDEQGGSSFEYGADNQISADLVVIDEASMVDAELGAALLRALPDGCHLLLVGDPAQLPSIGPGRVLGDMLDAQVFPTTELTTLYRQQDGGQIARLAAAIRGGTLLPPDPADREVVIVPAHDSEDAARRVGQLVTDSIPRVLGIAAADIQVVTPVHRGPAGTAALNTELKRLLNPHPPVGARSVRGFDVGDRVVATANYFDAEPFGYANGEIGTVVETDRNAVTVDFPGGPAEISGKALGDLLHGWAITVHRAQGSEWDAVIAVLPPEAGRMLSRPLIYTALTRARRHLSVVHAAGPALAHAVRAVSARPRRTRLQRLLN